MLIQQSHVLCICSASIFPKTDAALADFGYHVYPLYALWLCDLPKT